MSRSTVLVTGGNSGIGFEASRELARQGWHVVIASRDARASAAAVQRIASEAGSDAISALGVDLGSLASVRQLAKEIDERDLPLRALVCNAGLQFRQGPRLSPEGYELTFAVNHLGHFLLTNLLLARLLANAPARVVVVASGVHDPKLRTGMPKAEIADFETLAATGGPRRDVFDGGLAYVNSKLCNLWFSYELARRLDAAGLAKGGAALAVNGYDPGLVPGSGLARDYPAPLRWIWNGMLPAIASVATHAVAGISTAPRSGRALARLVTDPALDGVTGRYFPSTARWREAPSSEASYDRERAAELWRESVRMTRLAPAESPLAGSG